MILSIILSVMVISIIVSSIQQYYGNKCKWGKRTKDAKWESGEGNKAE